MKRGMKICVDAAMYAIFLYLMSYRAGRGLFLHGVWGCIPMRPSRNSRRK